MHLLSKQGASNSDQVDGAFVLVINDMLGKQMSKGRFIGERLRRERWTRVVSLISTRKRLFIANINKKVSCYEISDKGPTKKSYLAMITLSDLTLSPKVIWVFV